jgi:membrane fusion protein, multidrug efflux system
MSADGGKPEVDRSATDAAPRPRVAPTVNRRRRYLIMAVVPVAIALVGGYFWLTGGRYMSTDNAYVQLDKVTINPLVSGRIVKAPVTENEHVNAGDVLFVIDPQPYRIALDAANAALASARLQVGELRAAYQQAMAAEKAASDDVAFKQKIFDRQQGLLAKGVSSQASYDQAENDLHSAEQALAQAKQHTESAMSALGGDPTIKTDDHPLVLAALAQRDQAALNLANTTVTAPAAGVVAQADRLVVGQQVSPQTAVMSLVETDTSWVEANFKETELTDMRAGQTATVTVDAYPGRQLVGKVASIGAGTGAEFSLLPAQNATGNWVKVVQRVPVRIKFDTPPNDLPLRAGLSASVSVDTKSGPGTAAAADAQ